MMTVDDAVQRYAEQGHSVERSTIIRRIHDGTISAVLLGKVWILAEPLPQFDKVRRHPTGRPKGSKNKKTKQHSSAHSKLLAAQRAVSRKSKNETTTDIERSD